MIPVAALLLGPWIVASGPIYVGTERNLRVDIPRIESTVQVDGRLSEPVWQQAARLTGFSQYAPDDGRPAADETEILVWYSPSAIYFGVRAHAAPGSVRATLGDRDHIDNDDWVQVFLSTFNDGRQASMFGVNPLGVQMDGALVEGTGSSGGGFGGVAGGRAAPDLSPDFVFDSKGHLTDYGYEIEMRIPFKSLRYQSAAAQDWGVHIVRRIQSTGHEDSWAPARRSAASFLDQSGTLVGLKGLHRGVVMDLNPVVTSRVDGTPDGRDGWSYDPHKPDVGGNVRWGLTPNLTLNATANPDFSQVEADATQFQIDPRQALFFPEKRPFFLDGIEFFQTPNSLVYSRRIVDPVAAVKLTGKVAGTTVAALTAMDDASTSLDGTSHPVFNIVRVQRDIGSASRGALLYTDRIEPGFANHVAAADAHVVWSKIYALDLQGAISRTSRDGIETSGPLWQVFLRRSGRRHSLEYALTGNDPAFRAATGFIGRSGTVDGSLQNQVALYGRPGAFVEKWTGDVQLQGTWNYRSFVDGAQALERKLHVNNNFFLHGGWHGGFSVLVERYGFDPSIYSNYAVLDRGVLRPFSGQTLPNLDYVLTLDTPRVHGVAANVLFIWGRDENFFEWSSANIVYSFLTLAWRPTERVRVDFSHNLQSFERRSDNSYVGIRRVPRLKFEYQATRSIFFRYVGEYATNYQDAFRDDGRTGLPIVFVAPDGTFTPSSAVRARSFRNDWLFSYQPTPGTVLFAGYGNTLANPAASDKETIRTDTLRRTRDGFFLKLSYLFRM
jgi:hypothetical protein